MLAETYSAPKPNDEIAEAFLAWQRDVRRRAPITLYQYAALLDRFLDHLGSRHLSTVMLEDIEAWLARPRQGRGQGRPPSPSTLQSEIAVLRGLFRFAVARGMLREDPTVLLHPPKVRNEQPKAIDDEVWIATWGRSILPAEALIVLGLGYFCGLRRAEIANLEVRHVDVRRKRLVGFTRKGGGDDVLDYGELVGLVHDELPALCPEPARLLRPFHRQVEAAGSGLILPWAMTSTSAQQMYKVTAANDPQRIYKRFKQWRIPFTPHQLRHSFVTNLLRCEVPIDIVSRLANHQNVTVTMRYRKTSGSEIRDLRRRRALRDMHQRD